MKNKLLIVITLLISAISIAQNGINYKAQIKDASGELVVNQAVTIHFQVTSTSYVYIEEHNPTTDVNGLITVNIGEGTPLSGNFSTVDWSSDAYFLNVQVDTGDGLVNLGTTPFKHVPYAIYAEAAGNVSGLEAINEGNGQGWRFIGRNPNLYGNIGSFGVDLSVSLTSSSSKGATGQFSFAGGQGTTASGSSSTAFGFETRAESFGNTAIGIFNVGGGNPTGNAPTNPLFEIGNGISSSNRSNALTVLQNGVITAPSLEIVEITNDKALITKEYYEAVDTKGLEQISEGGNNGFRLVGKNPIQYGDIGDAAVDLSFSIGTNADHGATGDRSFAIGVSTIASGVNSMAMGFESEASGGNSLAMGYRTKADANSSVAIGVNNIGGGNPLNLTPTDPVFEIGNGTATVASNAFTVLKNGKVGIGKHTGMEGMLEIESNSTSTQPQLALIEDNSGFARLKFRNTNRSGNDYWDIAGFIGTTAADDRLNFFNSDGGNIMSLEGDGDVFVNGSLVHASDRRLKRDIETIEYGIAEILKLQPVQYNWKNKEDKPHKSLGVLAQEIQKIIPNVVQTGADENQTLRVSYTELIPVLIKAIQEQQEIIDTQNEKFAALEKMVLTLVAKSESNTSNDNSRNQTTEK